MITAEIILWLTNLVFGFIEFIIGLRILLKLIGASTIAPFVNWVYNTSQTLLAPFEGMLPSTRFARGVYLVDFSALFALIVYAFIGYLITEALHYIAYHSRRYRGWEESPRRRRRNVEEAE